MNKTLQSEILAKIKTKVLELNPQAEVILFGSRARGDYREDSDWDLLILLPEEVNLQTKRKYSDITFQIELDYLISISTLVYSQKEWNEKLCISSLFQNVEKEGLVL